MVGHSAALSAAQKDVALADKMVDQMVGSTGIASAGWKDESWVGCWAACSECRKVGRLVDSWVAAKDASSAAATVACSVGLTGSA